jgi:hypothetical protein
MGAALGRAQAVLQEDAQAVATGLSLPRPWPSPC